MRLVATTALLILASSSLDLGGVVNAVNPNVSRKAAKPEPKNPFASVLADMDGDGVRELVKIHHVKTKGVDRLSIHDQRTDTKTNRINMDSGEHWGPGAYPTSIASGNVDNDPNMEIAVSRKNSVNMRVALYDFESTRSSGVRSIGQMKLVQEFGKDWGRKYFARQVAFGDLNGDGRDELIITTNAPDRLYNADPDPKRPGPVMIYARFGSSQKFQRAHHVDGHFKGFKVGFIAIRDMDKDGKMDLLVTERAKKGVKTPRFKILAPAQAQNVAIASRLKLVSKGKKKFANSFFISKNETKIASAQIK